VGAGIALLVARHALLSSGFALGLSVQGLVTMRAGAQVAYYGSLLGVLGALSRRRGIGFAQAFGLVQTAWLSSAAWVVAGLFAVRLVSTMYGAISQGLGWAPPARATSQLTTWFGADILGLALAMGTVVVLGPFVEEVVFRGMLLPALRRMTGPWIAIVLSALLFAASHLTLWTFFPLTVLGVVLGWLATTKDSVWPAVALHAGYNAVAVVAAFYVMGTVGA
jgi:membrane protease YdiL (CAAX protease family)